LRHIRLLHTESFRLAAWFAVLFLGLTGALVVTVYWTVEHAEREALLATVDDDIDAIRNDYRTNGLGDAINISRQMTERQSRDLHGERMYLLLTDRQRGKLAGNLDDVPWRLGLFSMTLKLPNAGRGGTVQLMGEGLMLDDGLYLFMGRDLRPFDFTRRRILTAFAWIAGAALALAVGCGVLFSVQFMHRIDEFTETCEGIVQGHFNDRLATHGKSDELDRLANAVNHMLDRISALLDNLRQVSSDIAHDLRTPLTHLRQRLEVASIKSATVEDYAGAVSRAIDDTDQLLSIFHALLRISQIEAGTRAATFAPVNLSELLRELYDMYRPVAEDHQQTLVADIPSGIAIRGDAELLSQMCVNVLENAFRHTPAGSTVRMTVREQHAGVALCISDDGPGIPEHERANVFKRFYRLGESRTTPGNGLGLALVSAIADLHRARVELGDARPGLIVKILLPAMTAAAVAT
jgi:signal transduction histidine kinase